MELLLAAMPALAQSQSPPTPQPPDKQTADDKKGGNQQTVGSNDRLFYALPNFQTVDTAEQLPPLTAGQKFKLQARSQFDYFEIRGTEFLQGSARLAIHPRVTDKAPLDMASATGQSGAMAGSRTSWSGPFSLPLCDRTRDITCSAGVILAPCGLRHQPHRCHSLRFGTDGVQRFSDPGRCCGRGHFDVQLSSPRRA